MRAILLAFLVAAPLCAVGCHKSADVSAADNTSRNNRDHSTEPSADHAANSGTDLTITKDVRKAIVADGDLSTNAHNVKIVVDKGVVTLAGPVKSDDERAKVEALAMNVPGTTKVVNQLEVIIN